MAHLLLTNGKVFFKERLRITKGKFINAPKARLHEWIRACGRNRADLAGRANDRNTVYALRTRDGTYGLHFAELNGTSTTRTDSRDSAPEQPKQEVSAEKLATLIAGDFYENAVGSLLQTRFSRRSVVGQHAGSRSGTANQDPGCSRRCGAHVLTAVPSDGGDDPCVRRCSRSWCRALCGWRTSQDPWSQQNESGRLD